MELPKQEDHPELDTVEKRAESLSKKANEHDGKGCVFCNQKMFWLEHDKGLREGHIYSDAGISEARISGVCEFCFDITTLSGNREENPELYDHYKALKEKS